METKQCIKCQETKTLDQFYKSKHNSDKLGFDKYCKYCRVGASIKSHRGGNKKPCTVSECEMSHYAKGMCRTHYARWYRHGTTDSLLDIIPNKKIYKYAKQDLKYSREYVLMYKYGLTFDKFLEMSKDGCQICRETRERNLNVEHDHNCCNGYGATCGKCVRGVVCNRCNLTIAKYENGLIRDDNELKDKIKEYLEAYNGQTKEY